MGFPNDEVGKCDNDYYGIELPYIAMRNWWQYYYDAINILNEQVHTNETDIGMIETDIANLTALVNDHSARHEVGGADIISLTGLEGTNIKVDTITEKTTDAGVTIEGIKLEDTRITGLSDPSADDEPVTLGYLTAIIQGLDPQESVIDKDLSTPPGSPSTGDRYIIKPTGTGAWSGHDNEIAEWNGSSWDFTAPSDGMFCFVEDEEKFYFYDADADAWKLMGSIISHNNLSGLQGGTTDEYYHLTSAEHTELSAWLPNVTLDADGDIHLPDDVSVYMGDADEMEINYSAGGYGQIITDALWFFDVADNVGFGYDESDKIYFYFYNNEVEIDNVGIYFNSARNNIDFFIRKDSAIATADALAYDAGSDYFDINSDIHIPDDKKIYFGDGDDGFIEYASSSSALRIVADTIYYSNDISKRGIDVYKSGNQNIIDLWAYDGSGWNILRILSDDVSPYNKIVLNSENEDVDIFMNKNSSGNFFEFDSGNNELILSPDTLYLDDQYLTSPITLSESGETALDTISQSIVGAINEIHPVSHRCECLTFTDQGNPYVTENGVAWTNKGDFVFCGTSVGGVPSAIKAMGWRVSGTATFSIRIYDFTNSQVIATVTGLSNTTKQVIDLGTLSNLPTTGAIFEVQVQASAVGSSWALSGVAISY